MGEAVVVVVLFMGDGQTQNWEQSMSHQKKGSHTSPYHFVLSPWVSMASSMLYHQDNLSISHVLNAAKHLNSLATSCVCEHNIIFSSPTFFGNQVSPPPHSCPPSTSH
jgi:hypothetical protein